MLQCQLQRFEVHWQQLEPIYFVAYCRTLVRKIIQKLFIVILKRLDLTPLQILTAVIN